MARSKNKKPSETRPADKRREQAGTLSAGARWTGLLAAGGLAVVVMAAYGPALRGPFVFDDRYLPFQDPGFQNRPVWEWLKLSRPLLLLTYWVNYRLFGLDPFPYHLLNVLFHLGAGWMVYRLVRWGLEQVKADRTRDAWIAAFAASVFLLHPLQTEAVSYVASRSENLSVLLALSAWVLFLHWRTEPVTFRRAAVILALLLAAVLSKEHTAVVPALFLLTDIWWSRRDWWETLRAQWRLYLLLAGSALAGLGWVWRVLSQSDTAGFRVAGLPWHHYFYTECQVIWIYLRMWVLPYGQNVDHFYPIARSFWNPATLAGFAALVATGIAAVALRRRYPLACFGWLVFLFLIAPTSSVIPIQDAMAERRLYLPSVGLLLILAEAIRRGNWAWKRQLVVMASIGILLAGLTWRRNLAWASETALWEDSVRKNPANPRAHFHLAYAHYLNQRCEAAVAEYEQAARWQKPDYRLLVDWALALDCAGRYAEAVEKLHQALALEDRGHGWATLGMLHGKHGNYREALLALERAEAKAPRNPWVYFYRGNVYAAQGAREQAVQAYRRALELDPDLDAARRALLQLLRQPAR